MCCAERSQESEMLGGAMSAGPQESQMGVGAPVGQGQTFAGAIEPELAAYLRERQGRMAAMAPGQQGKRPGGGMGEGPRKRQMGAMAPGQRGQMPGGGMGEGPQESQTRAMSLGQQGEMPGGGMRAGPQESRTRAMARAGQAQTPSGTIEPELAAYLRERQDQTAVLPGRRG